jgi:hypothetical protein
VKYDVNFTVQCPECQEDINVGYAGPKGLQQHRGSKRCQEAIARKEKLKNNKKIRTPFDVGVCETSWVCSSIKNGG